MEVTVGEKWITVGLSPDQALLLAENLMRQVRTGDANTNRPEMVINGGTDNAIGRRFTVFVHPDPLRHARGYAGMEE